MTFPNATPPETPVPDEIFPGVLVHVYGRTDVGRTREHNEDSFIVADLTAQRTELQPELTTHVSGDRGSLFMVADGMGGAAAGEIASQMAVEIVLRELRAQWQSADQHDEVTFARCLKQATQRANAEIHEFAVAHPEYRGMGTTATIAGLLNDTLYVAQVGDSRAYLVRGGTARQITKDQSLIQRLVDAGELTEEEARVSERRNIILQAIGPEANIKIDLTHQQVRRGDVLVLCSDGLSGLVSREEIGEIVAGEEDLESACQRLIDTANERGGPDNITVIVARFEGLALGRASSDDAVGHRVYGQAETGTMPAATTATAEVPRRAPERRRTEPMAAPPMGAVADTGSAPATPVTPMPAVPADIVGSAEPALSPEVSFELARAARLGSAAASERRRRGMLYMAILLLAMLVGAAWLVYRLSTRLSLTPPAAGQPAGSPPAQGP